MRKINYSNRFKRDYRREQSGRHGRKLEAMIKEAVGLLSSGRPFPRRYFDHALTGQWLDHRDCHLRPDLVLIYRFLDNGDIDLVVSAHTASWGFNIKFLRLSSYLLISAPSGSRRGSKGNGVEKLRLSPQL